MIKIAEISVVTAYSDLMAFILVLGLFYMFHRYRVGRDEHADVIFDQLCIMIMINAITNGLSYALHYQESHVPEIVRMILPSLAEFSTLVILFLWLLYVDYRVYGIWERVLGVRRVFAPPVVIFAILMVINLFTGMMFHVDEMHIFTGGPLFYVLTAFQYIYGLFPIVVVIRYIRAQGSLHFFRTSAMVIPVLVAAIFTMFSDYSARALGFAVAMVFMHISYISRWRFEDTRSGFYNKQYLAHIYDMVSAGKTNYKSALFFETCSDSKEVYDLLRQELPKDSEMIRIMPDTFVLFSENGDNSMIMFIKSMIEDAVEEYKKNHPSQTGMDLKVSGKHRKKTETAMEFVKRVAALN